MRNIKLTEAEWRYICDTLYYGTGDLSDSWYPAYPSKSWLRKSALLKRAQRKIYNSKREVA